MSTFPQVPLDIHTELFYSGVWNDITGDVRSPDRIVIKHGAADETSQTYPCTCNLALDNRDGKYSPRNPTSPLYGKIGRNTPLRVRVGTSSPTSWLVGGGSVGSCVATPDTAALDIVGDLDLRMDIAPTSWRPTAPTVLASKYLITPEQRSWGLRLLANGTLEFGWGTDGTNATITRVVSTVAIPSASTRLSVRATLKVNNGAAGNTVTFYTAPTLGGTYTQLGSAVVTAGVTTVFAGSAQLIIGARDLDFNGFVFTTDGVTYSGQVFGLELRNGIAGTIVADPDFTIQGPATTSFVDATSKRWTLLGSDFISYQDNSVRFTGEVSEWPPRWDVTGKEVRSPIVASGIRRRIGQGSAVLRSALYRGITSSAITRPVAYWPCEDAAGATSLASAFNQAPMTITSLGTGVKPASFTGVAASAPIPTFAPGGRLDGPVPPYTPSANLRGMAFVNVPAAGPGTATTVIRMQTTGGNTESWFLDVTATGAFRLRAFAFGGATLVDSTVGASINGQSGMLWILLQQVGPDITWQVGFAAVGAPGAGVFTSTLSGNTFGTCINMIIGQNFDVSGLSVGHVVVMNSADFFSILPFMNAWSPEAATDRVARLGSEQSVPVGYMVGDAGSEQMGAQLPMRFLDLLNDVQTTDLGILAERRDSNTINYRARSSMYNTTPVLALDYTLGHLAQPVEPTDDDQHIKNDITVARTGGTNVRLVQTTGPLSTQAAPNGVGQYDTSLTINVAADGQLANQAGWRLGLGTLDKSRFPVLGINLARNPELIPNVSTLQLGDRITVANPPVWLAPELVDVLVQGWTETLSQYQWDMKFNTSPAALFQVVKLDDTVLGRIDAAASVLTAPTTSTATTLAVVDTGGPGWTTAGGDMPIPITVGGEAMSATAIGAITAPTFVAAGTAAAGNNASVVPGLPAGATGGDLLLVWASIRSLGVGSPIPPGGYTMLFDGSNGRLFGKIHSGSETAPTIAFTNGSAGDTTIAQMAAFRGIGLQILNGPVFQPNFTPAQNIAYPALPITGPNALILYLGWKQSSWTSVATIAGANLIGATSSALGSTAGLVWDYLIQSTAANIPAGSFTVTGGSSASSSGSMIALAGGGQTFTVTRSVNGVVKAHAAGESVHLTRTPYIAL